MSQRAFLAEFDADLHWAFAGAGMADNGVYTPPAPLPPVDPDAPPPAAMPCSVYVDRDMQTLGETLQFKAGRVEVAYLVAAMAEPPRKGGRLLVDGDTYINDDEISNDGSLSRWLVRRG